MPSDSGGGGGGSGPGSTKPDSRPASRSSMASSARAPTPSGMMGGVGAGGAPGTPGSSVGGAQEAKKRKSEDKIDIASLPNTLKIPLIMGDGTKMADGVSNKELKGLLESNPSIKVSQQFPLMIIFARNHFIYLPVSIFDCQLMLNIQSVVTHYYKFHH